MGMGAVEDYYGTLIGPFSLLQTPFPLPRATVLLVITYLPPLDYPTMHPALSHYLPN
jgi:hypothetical protein